MRNVLDYLFYKNYKFFLLQKYRKSPREKAIGGTFFVYLINIISIWKILSIVFDNYIYIISLIVIVLTIILYTFMNYFYSINRAKKIIIWYDNLDAKKVKLDIAVWLLIIFSISVLFSLFFWLS